MSTDEKVNPQQPVSYQRTEIRNGSEAMKGWKSTRLETSWLFAGACPRCDHQTEKEIPDKAIVLKLATTLELPTSETYVVECDCGEPHKDRPDEGKGCGARWGVEIKQ